FGIVMKTFLENNKIYFSTVATISISLSSLFVSCASYKVATVQADISKAGISPHFYLSQSGYHDERVGRLTERYLSIENSGGEVKALDSTLCSVIEVEFSENEQRVTRLLPIQGYYDIYGKTMNPDETSIKYRGHLNADKYAALHRDVLEYNLKSSTQPILMNINHAIKLEYTNILDEEFTEYFVGLNRAKPSEAEELLNICTQAFINNEVTYRLSEIALKDILAVTGGNNT
ncbi:hypothetical protein, partial [Vibrio parahaemolyticus]